MVQRDTGMTLADVAGIDEAKAELEEIVSLLKAQPKYSRLDARIPKGILLVGPPGTGKVEMDDFTGAVERVAVGSERRGRLLKAHERQIVAHHEMGHALAAADLPGMGPVHNVSIIPRSVGALGYTLQRPTKDHFLIAWQSQTFAWWWRWPVARRRN